MGIFNEHSSSSDTAVTTIGERGPVGPVGPAGVGYKLDLNGNYDLENKKLVNVMQGTNNNDVVTKSQLDTKTSLLDGARTHGYIVNNKAVIYSQSGAVHAKSFYLQDQNEDEVRILTDNQDYDNVHAIIPNLKFFDGFGGRERSEFMLTSVDQNVTGKKTFQNIEVPTPTSNSHPVNKQYLDSQLQTKPNKTDVLLLDGTTHMIGDLDLRGNKIILPGEIDMDRKLITNLDTNENQDLSAVNMITLKNKVEPKADKDYADFEITKQNALINNTFVKKTGDQMNGDLILPHDSYPVEGNTNKAISYETQREIFLSRKESFPMQADINMNNNFIQNIATPTSSHQVTNKGYCDYNFFKQTKGRGDNGSTFNESKRFNRNT